MVPTRPTGGTGPGAVRGGGTRIGLFGGTFDPIHRGHVQVAEAVRDALGLDRMLVVVANEPWQKQGRPVSPAEDRYAMVAAALDDRPGLEPSRIELDRGGPSYTVDTVRQLLADQPDAEIVVVVGADVVAALDTWRQHEALRDLVTLAVVDRPGAPLADPPTRMAGGARGGGSGRRVEHRPPGPPRGGRAGGGPGARGRHPLPVRAWSVRCGEMTVRLTPTESEPTPPPPVPAAPTPPHAGPAGGAPTPEVTPGASPVVGPAPPSPPDAVPGQVDAPGADGRRALREARRRRRRTSLLCAAVVAVCLALTIVVVVLARDRPVGTPSSAAATAPTALVPAAAPAVDVTASPTASTRGATAPEGGNP